GRATLSELAVRKLEQESNRGDRHPGRPAPRRRALGDPRRRPALRAALPRRTRGGSDLDRLQPLPARVPARRPAPPRLPLPLVSGPVRKFSYVPARLQTVA